jgi:hypothetical protein
MKLSRTSRNRFVFHLRKREQRLLFDTLQLYPLVPPAHHRLAKTDPSSNDDEMQALLDEALAEDRRENQKRVLALVKKAHRYNETTRRIELTLTRAQMEWLLQVLNDVRVGSWLALGEPEAGEEPEINEANARYLLALELCGLFQSLFLAALGVEQSPRWG